MEYSTLQTHQTGWPPPTARAGLGDLVTLDLAGKERLRAASPSPPQSFLLALRRDAWVGGGWTAVSFPPLGGEKKPGVGS